MAVMPKTLAPALRRARRAASASLSLFPSTMSYSNVPSNTAPIASNEKGMMRFPAAFDFGL